MRTYLDLIDRLRTYVGNDGSDQKSTAVIRAARESVEAIATKHDWAYYKSTFRINTNGPYSTGTVVYDHTGGAYERMLTLTTGTWPTWSEYGTVVISNVPYDIDKRISNTIVTLRQNSCPSGDIASTTYLIYQARYDLPENFVSIHRPIITGQNSTCAYVGYDAFLLRRNLNDGQGLPTMFTTLDNGYGRKQLLLWNAPDTEYQFEGQYKRRPNFPNVVEENRGKIALTLGSTALTGTSTLFRSVMEGAVLRVGYDGTVPTGWDSINPPESEYLIDTFTSTTAMTLTSVATSTVSNRGYSISSRLDVADGAMFALLCQMGYKRLRIALSKNATNEELREYERVELEAKGADGQNYSDADVARVSQCRVGFVSRPASWMRDIPGNG